MPKDKELTQKELAYKPIDENPIRIDLKEWKAYDDIFKLLKRKLGLPEFCGENWDAIWDLADGFTSRPVIIEFYNLSYAREKFPEDVQIILEIIARIHKGHPHIEYTFFE